MDKKEAMAFRNSSDGGNLIDNDKDTNQMDGDMELLLDQSFPNIEIGTIERRYARNESDDKSNCSSALMPSSNNFDIRGNSESLTANKEDHKSGIVEDEVFDDAVTELDVIPFNTYGKTKTTYISNTTESSATSTANKPNSRLYCESSHVGLLERCGRWLMSIPRDDEVALQNTGEYRDFLNAFDRLGEAHRRTVILERRHLLETEDSTLLASSDPVTDDSREEARPDISSVHILTVHPFTRYRQHPMAATESRRRNFSFLQHFAVDDILLRTFEYIDCSSLVRTGTTCHRFRELTNRSAEQRVASLADGRLLRSAIRMLRAQEQIEGVNVFEERGKYLPIPMLGLRRRIIVTGAGDSEMNGIYFCTGCNGNGFLFTKPRMPERRVSGNIRNVDQQPVGQAPLARARLQHPIDLEGVENPVRDRLGVVNPVMIGEVNGDEDDNDQRDGGVDVLFGDEPKRSRLLRCVISKRFSNEASN